MTITPRLRALQRRLHAQTFDMLLAEVERLADENADLRQRLSWAEDCAERWREDAISAINDAAERSGGAPGLTMAGHLVVVPPTQGGLHA